MKIKEFLLTGAIILLLNPLVGYSQQVTLTIEDIKTSNPISYVNVQIKDLQEGKNYYYAGDYDGRVEVGSHKNVKIIVTAVGYEQFVDTISLLSTRKIALNPVSFDIHEVVVTGQIEPQRVDQSIYKVKVIGAKEIEDKAAVNLNDLMTSELKFRTFNDGILGSSLSIQGLSGNNVKVLIDGVPVLGREGGNVDLSQLNLYNVDHIEIVEGPLSVLYGSNSLAGAINIITKENKFNRWKAVLNSYLESVGKYNFDGAFHYRKNNSSFMISGGRNFNQEKDLDPSVRSTLWKPKEQYLGDFIYIFDDSKNKLKLKSSLLHELMIDKGTPRPPYGEIARDVYLTTVRKVFSLNYDRKLSQDKGLGLLISFSDYSRKNEDFLKDLTTLEMTPTAVDTTISVNWIARAEWKNFAENRKFNYQFGFDLNYESGKGDKIQGLEKEISDYAIYWTGQYKHLKVIQIQPGLRYSYNTAFKTPLVPSINIKFSPMPLLDFRLSYVRGFRSPGIKELYMDFHDTNHNLEGNPNLKPEYGHNFNFSGNINTDKLYKLHYSNIKIDLFFNSMENKIDLAAVNAEELHYQYVNIARYGTGGGFIQFEYKFHPYLDFSAGYGQTGYLTSTDGLDLNLDTIHWSKDFTASISHSFIAINLETSLFYKFNGSLPRYVINEDNILEFSYLQPYHTLDLSLATDFLKSRLKLSGGIKNLFDNYTVGQSSAAGGAHTGEGGMPVSMGRSIFLKLSYQFF
jgi:outer membrane receptor for ferrienterochelin and colicins